MEEKELRGSKVFADLFVPGAFKEQEQFLKVAEELEIRIAPGNYDLLVTNDHKELRKNRRKYLLAAGIAKSNKEAAKLLVDTYYDFIIIDGFRLRRNVAQMARRYETPLLIPLFYYIREEKLRELSRTLELLNHYSFIFLIGSGAETLGQLRAGRDLAAIAILFGLYPDKAHLAVTKWPLQVIKRAEELERNPAWGVEIWD